MGLSNLTADNKHKRNNPEKTTPAVTSQQTNITTHQHITGKTASTTKGNIDLLWASPDEQRCWPNEDTAKI